MVYFTRTAIIPVVCCHLGVAVDCLPCGAQPEAGPRPQQRYSEKVVPFWSDLSVDSMPGSLPQPSGQLEKRSKVLPARQLGDSPLDSHNQLRGTPGMEH